MVTHDVVFLHPPFNIEPLATQPSPSQTVRECPFSLMPMGMVSMAALLEDEGFETEVINLSLEMALNSSVTEVLRQVDSKIYAIDLHWMTHSNGAIQTAELCKKLHPNSIVVLGGFTATYYDLEIMRSYPFIDAIVRGEAEYPMLRLARKPFLKKSGSEIRGLTWRNRNEVRQNELAHPPTNLDALDFIRLKLLRHSDGYFKCNGQQYIPGLKNALWLCIGRSCPYECIYCGGSRSCYQLLTGRRTPIFRQPEKVAQDISKLQDMNVKIVRISHDPEIFGREYALSLLKSAKQYSVDTSLYWESHRLPSNEFIRLARNTFSSVSVALSPESTSEEVRKVAGRRFSNHELHNVLDILEKYEVASTIYFLVGLPGEIHSSVKDIMLFAEKVAGERKYSWVHPPIPYTIDPHCSMALNPKKYGVNLHFKSFDDYKQAFARFYDSAMPMTRMLIGHETATLSRDAIATYTNLISKFILNLDQEGFKANVEFTTESRFISAAMESQSEVYL